MSSLTGVRLLKGFPGVTLGVCPERRYRLVGDVDFEGAKSVASKITPVPVRRFCVAAQG